MNLGREKPVGDARNPVAAQDDLLDWSDAPRWRTAIGTHEPLSALRVRLGV
ncbi:hypothetical protein [Pirellulimonas nuda]|uniref:hypothetical protein n=1 Tax=Pirellulimonas nuda TaxID=2528009 RepID=UPI0018D49729|nr:hypothetical protein [Pirellulimonas nuda]